MKNLFDVIIVGGGPAGCAAALTFRKVAPQFRVAIYNSSSEELPRVGETLPGLAKNYLQQLGAWKKFVDGGHVEACGTVSNWGSEEMQPNDFIFSRAGSGWHLNRKKFDQSLQELVGETGVEVFLKQKVVEADFDSNDCLVWVEGNPDPLHARFLVDATGRSAQISRRFGLHWNRIDRLSAFFRIFSGSDIEQARTMVEAVPYGWWYVTGLPEQKHIVALMTDTDIAVENSFHQSAGWNQALSETTFIKGVLQESKTMTQLLNCPAQSGVLDSIHSQHSLAVGDAAMTFDPLSSLGIFKALRSGIYGAYAACDLLLQGDNKGLIKYQQMVAADFAAFCTQRHSHYSRETRWAGKTFWARRHSWNASSSISPIDEKAFLKGAK